jgi:hypothetical protein
VEGLEKLIFTHIYLTMNIGLVDNSDRERKKAERIYQVAQKIGPLRQSWKRRIANKLWTELCLKEILPKQKFSLATNLIFPS